MRTMKNIFLEISTVRTGLCPSIDAMLLDILEDVFVWCANETFFCVKMIYPKMSLMLSKITSIYVYR